MAEPVGPLAGVHVVEQTAGLAGAYAGFLLAGLGADVVRLESPGTRRTPRDAVLQRGKRSVTGDACRARLLAGADVTLSDESAPDVRASPERIDCRVTGWDGRTDLPPDEALLAAATGMQAMQWSWARSPVWFVTPMVGYMAGILAALGVTAALLARRRGAPGQRVEVSGLGAAMALNSGTYVTGPEARGSLSQFGDPRGQIATYALFPTADGWLFVGALTQAFLVKLMTVLDRVELLADPRLQTSPLAFGVPEIKELVRREIDPIFASRSTAEWIRRLREADIPCGAVRSREQALADPQARALGLVVPIEDPALGSMLQPGVPAIFSDTPVSPPTAARRPGDDTAAVCAEAAAWRPAACEARTRPPAPLDGLRVLDLTSFIAGPFCPMLLADLGADVVKIESADGDPFRMAAFAFVGWNRGKRSLVLDLKQPAGRDVLLDLARGTDAVVDNFRAGVMDRLGIGWEALRTGNGRLVHTSITGWGIDGPLATLPGFDPIFQAQSGYMHAQGGADDPVFHMVAYNDYSAGALGALATVAALVARERTGRGQRVDVSLFRTSYVAQAAELAPGAPRGGRDHLGPTACRRVYACTDGWICIASATPEHADVLGRLAGTAVAPEDPPDGASATALARALAGRPRAAAVAELRAAGVPAVACLGFDELFTDPVLRDAGCVVRDTHPALGELRVPGPFIRFSATPVRFQRSAPLLGADGPAILAAAGYAPPRVAELLDAGVVGRGG